MAKPKVLTVKALQQELAKAHPDAVVVLYSDAEGNEMHPLQTVRTMGRCNWHGKDYPGSVYLIPIHTF